MLTDLKNPLNLADAALDSLEQALQTYSELDAELPPRLVRYLVDGDDETAIADLIKTLHHGMTQQRQRMQRGVYIGGFLGLGFPFPFQLSQSVWGDTLLLTWLADNPLSDTEFYSRLSMMLCGLFGSSINASGQVQLPSLKERLPLFLQTGLLRLRSASINQEAVQFLTAEVVDALYVKAGESPGAFARLVYNVNPNDHQQKQLAECSIHLNEFAEYTLKHTAIVQAALQHPERDRRIHTLHMLTKVNVPIEAFVAAIAQSAVSSAKTEREVATPLLRQNPQAAIPILQAQAESGKASERQHAVQLLWELAGEQMQPFLESRLEVEKAAKVRSILEQLLATPSAAAIASTAPSLPPLPAVEFTVPVPDSAAPLLKKMVVAFNEGRMQSRRNLLQNLSGYHQPGMSHADVFRMNSFSQQTANAIIQMLDEIKANPHNSQLNEAELLKRFSLILDQNYGHRDITLPVMTEALQSGTGKDCCEIQYVGGHYHVKQLKLEIKAFLAAPETSLIQTVRLLILMRYLSAKSFRRNPALFEAEGHELLLFYRQHHPDCGGLRELAAVLESLQLSPWRIGQEMLSSWGASQFWRWGNDAIWPYFAERLQLLEDALTLNTGSSWETGYYEQQRQRQNAFKVLKAFPQPPAQLTSRLWQLAFEGPKAERGIVQDCLNALDDTPNRILAALSDPNREIRTIAAAWLGDRGDPATIPSLKQALTKENSDAAKDIMLRSLEKLEASVDEFLDRDNLLKDSQKLLQPGIPKALHWFPWSALPTIHWRDTGEVVAPDILKGLLLQCLKQKNAEPGPILKRYVEMWQPDEREALGQFVLAGWIAQDTLPAYTPQEADQLAQNRAQQNFQYYQKLQQQYPNTTGAYYHTTYEELYRKEYNHLISTCKGSANKEKGILAIAAAGCGPRAIGPINTYLKTWYGHRMAQGKALLQVLAWIDDNSAIQLLLSVANRFRTKGIQKEAERLVTALAERHGWSRDELSDRTIPTAGFDDGVEQTLDYGSRQFTLLLDTDMSLVLKRPDGQVIKSLPAPRKDDDAELAKAAKKQLSETKKQIKQVLTLQRERLFEAMGTQRSWRFSDWDTYLNRHPIVGRYCQQLVWAIYELGTEGETLITTVRPLEDRTLTDANDDEVTPDAEAIMRLAHTCMVPAAAISAWQTHFADYDVSPLFPQFRPHPYHLPEDQQQATEITDFEGHIIDAFTLRGLLSKRGYTRGQTEDASWFYDYCKRFSGLGIEAVIEFSGNYLPEENRPVALTKLTFCELPEDGESEYIYSRPKLALGELPPVLLSEVWSELQAIAAQGSGYDPDWEKKVEY